MDSHRIMAHVVILMGPITLDLVFALESVSQMELIQMLTVLLVTPIARTTMYAIQQANVTIHLPQHATSRSTVA